MEIGQEKSKRSLYFAIVLFVLIPALLAFSSMVGGGDGGGNDVQILEGPVPLIGTPVPPFVSITTPEGFSVHYLNDLIFFSGVATDNNDGSDLTEELIWTSDIDGVIGTGGIFVRSDLSPGTHTITATVTSPLGGTNSDQKIITILDTPYSVKVYSGSPQSAFVYAEFAEQLSVVVKDPDGIPMEGVTVTFTAPSGMFSDTNLPVTTALSDVDGIATSAPYLGDQHPSTVVITAVIPYPSAPAEFTLTKYWPFDIYETIASCTAFRYYAVGIGDFNSDGRNDVAVPVQITIGTYGLYVHLQNPDGTLAAPVIYPTGDNPKSIAVGDFNDDDLDDIALGFYDDHQIGVYLQNSGGTLEDYVAYGINDYVPTSIAAGDLNNDGLEDLAVSLYTTKIGVLLQQSDGSLGTMSEYTASETLVDELGIGDLNDDGLADVVKTGGNPHLSVFLQNEYGTLDPVVTYGNATIARGVAVGDVTGDGRDDVAMIVISGLSGYLAVFEQNLTGTLDAAVLFEDDVAAVDVAIGDVNLNGLNDVVISYEDPGYSLYFQTPTGSLAGKWWQWDVPYTWTMDRQGVALGDVTGDGLIDIALLDREEGLSIIPHAVLAPAPVSAPGSISASDGVFGKVDINWDAVDHADTYNLYRDISPAGSGMQLFAEGLVGLFFTDLTVADGTLYYYWVEACNPSGCGPIGGPDSGYSSSFLLVSTFETGDFSEWTRVNDGKGFLYPCGNAAMHGIWGACVERGTNDKRKQLIDDTPLNQTRFSVRMSFDINSLSMAAGERFRFLQVKWGAERPFFIVLKYLGGQYLIQLNALRDDLTKVKSAWYLLTDAPHVIEVDWQAASSDGANDGFAELYIDDVFQQSLTGLDNDTIFVYSFRVGFTSRLDGKIISGIFYVDDVTTGNNGHIGLP